MFPQKNYGSDDSQNKNTTDGQPMNLNEDDFNINDVEIHTLKRDLTEIKSPQEKKIAIKSEDTKEPEARTTEKAGPFFQGGASKTTANAEIFSYKGIPEEKPNSYFNSNKTNNMLQKMEDLSTQEKSSTFNAPRVEEIKKEEAVSTSTEGIFNPIPETDNQTTTSPKNDSNSGSHGIGKAVAIAIMITVFIIIGAGGYYFWMTRVSPTPQENIVTNEIPVETAPAAEEVLPELSNQNSNYLMIDLTAADTKDISKILADYSKKVSTTNTIGLFEFLVTDEKNTPLKFEDFASMSGLAIPADILSQIGPDFKFYIYNYGDKTRLGLSIAVKDSAQVKASLLKKEPDLIQAFTPIYSNTTYSKPSSSFMEASYDKAPTVSIRYINITDSEDMSLDYAISNNQLVIGTTKTATFSIIDRLIQKNSTPTTPTK